MIASNGISAVIDRAVDDTLSQFCCKELVRFALRAVTKPPSYTAELFRIHSDRVIAPHETEYRTSVDELIEMCSLISIFTGDLATALRTRDMPEIDILRILRNKAIERYMTVYYPMSYGILARADLEGSLPSEFRSADSEERSDPAWGLALQRFLALNAQLLSDSSLLDFLFLLDDHVVHGTHITELQRAFANSERMAAWLDREERVALLDGLGRMLDFSEALRELLEDLTELPILRGRIWLHYSYWLGNGGARVRDTTDWLARALQSTALAQSDKDSASRALEITFARLTSARQYAGQVLDLIFPLVLPLPSLTA